LVKLRFRLVKLRFPLGFALLNLPRHPRPHLSVPRWTKKYTFPAQKFFLN
jgi:hypothetical protein